MTPYNQTETTELSRRDTLKGLAVLVGLASVPAGLVGLASEAEAGEISNSEIKRLMRRDSVDEILREEYSSGLINRVRYDGNRTNFKELVFQEHLSPKDKKPVLVMFYVGDERKNGFAKREAIIFEELAKEYQGKIKFVAYDINVQPDVIRRGNQKWYFGREVENGEKITLSPSIGMYSTFDLVRGETQNSNDGRIKQIDIMRGGSSKNKFINTAIKNVTGYWIPGNLFMQDNIDGDGKVYRLNNTYKDWKVVGKV